MELKNLTVGIIGGGVVGSAIARNWLEFVREVHVFDRLKERATSTFEKTINCDVVFVCLPTPQEGYGLFIGHITDFFSQEKVKANTKTVFVIKSTVPIGTTKKIKSDYGINLLYHSPEFLTARCAQVDAQIPSRNIIGIPNTEEKDTNLTLLRMYNLRFPGTPIYPMSSCESEAVKLFQNSFFAVKVGFWNECQEVARHLNLDFSSIMRGVLSDGRISPSHTQVPGPDGKFGFSGSCLPKDLACMMGHIIPCMGESHSTSICEATGIKNINHDRVRTS